MSRKENKLSEAVLTPHDRFFQSTLSDVKIARDLFEHHLPPEVKKITDLTTLTLCPRTFISKRFKKYEADIIYQVKMDGKIAYLYLLIEAQSTIDYMLPFRILCYIIEIMRYHIDKRKGSHLPIVFPMVFYSGEKAYTGPLTFASLFKGHEKLIEQILVNPLLLVDVNNISDEELKKHPYAGLVEFALKYAKKRDFIHHLRGHMDELKDWCDRLGLSALQNVLNYWVQVLSDKQLTDLEDVIEHELTDEVREGLMGTIAESWMERGRQQGIEKGIEIGMEKGIEIGMEKGMERAMLEMAERLLKAGAKSSLIEETTGFPSDKIKKIKENLRKKHH